MGYTRRTVLLAGASAIAVSGCIGEEPDDDDPADDPDDDLAADDADDELADEQNGDPADDDPDDDDADDDLDDDDQGDDPDDDPADDDPDDDQDDDHETVTVGAGGDLKFDPETLEIDPGTTVLFVWEGDHHNIVVSEQPDGADWEGVEDTQDTGYEHTHTFEVEGRYEYFCEPHQGQDMEAEVLVGDVESGDAENDSDDGGGGGDGGSDDNDDDGGYY